MASSSRDWGTMVLVRSAPTKELYPSATGGVCRSARSRGMSGRGRRRAAMRLYISVVVGSESSGGSEGA